MEGPSGFDHQHAIRRLLTTARRTFSRAATGIEQHIAARVSIRDDAARLQAGGRVFWIERTGLEQPASPPTTTATRIQQPGRPPDPCRGRPRLLVTGVTDEYHDPRRTMMPDHSLPISPRPAWASFEAVEEAAQAARACRIATGEVMTYVVDDWVVREHAGGRIEPLAPLVDFRDEDFPYPA